MTMINAKTNTILSSAIAQKQRDLQLSDYKFAVNLGIGRSLWQLTRSGQRQMGITVITAIVPYDPELIPEVIGFLRDGHE